MFVQGTVPYIDEKNSTMCYHLCLYIVARFMGISTAAAEIVLK